jgi:hypothetical protein
MIGGTLAAVGVSGMLAVLAAAPASAAGCRAFSADVYGGSRMQVTVTSHRSVTCAKARRVARGFYRLAVGSSGANESGGYGCAFAGGGDEVRCSRRLPDGSLGPVTLIWHQGRSSSR